MGPEIQRPVEKPIPHDLGPTTPEQIAIQALVDLIGKQIEEPLES